MTTGKDVEMLEGDMQDRVVVFKVRVRWEDAEALARLLWPFVEKITGKVGEKLPKMNEDVHG